MAFNPEEYNKLVSDLTGSGVTLVAVSKTKSVEDIMAAYEAGQRDFGKNYVQEMVQNHDQLPHDIRWHFIGHLQRNKVRYIAPFVHLIHGVDSLRLAREIDKEGRKIDRVINGLVQVHIAAEDTKHGFLPEEVKGVLSELNASGLPNFRVKGVMGMATFTEDTDQIREEFRSLSSLFRVLRDISYTDNLEMKHLSMGMSGDYLIAVKEGSNMVRIGSLIFGERNYEE